MTDDSQRSGYLDDTNYPATYFRELSPALLNYVAALAGEVPVNLEEPFSYLELGCGHGYSSMIHAAAFPQGQFHACDFNADCIEAARARAAESAVTNVRFQNVSFQELASQSLPEFDFIVLHGVYSWVNQAVRREIRELIQSQLKAGGIVYVSYNCLPGWSLEMPLRKMLVELAQTSQGASTEKIVHAVAELKRLSGAGMGFFAANPSALDAVDSYQKSPSGYLSHEFLNETWDPHYSVDVADEMLEADVELLGSATLTDNHESLLVSDPTAASISELETARLKQLAMDFAVNRQFRRDVFLRRKNGASPAVGALGDVVVGCLGDADDIGSTVQVPRGRFSFGAEFITDLKHLLLGGSRTLRELVTDLDGGGQGPDIARNLTYLIAAGELTPFAKSHAPEQLSVPTGFTSTSVARMVSQVAGSGESGYVATEVVGGGISVSPTQARAVLVIVDSQSGVASDESQLTLMRRFRRNGLLT